MQKKFFGGDLKPFLLFKPLGKGYYTPCFCKVTFELIELEKHTHLNGERFVRKDMAL